MNNNADTNRDKLTQCLNGIDENFRGLNTPLSIYTGGENGIVSEAKINEFAERLVSSQCNLFGYFVGISGIQRRHIQLLCYLILRAFDPDDETRDFSDFIRDAKALDECKSRERHIIAAFDNVGYASNAYNEGVLRRIRNSCKLLTGSSVSDGFSKDEIAVMKETIRKRGINANKLKKKCEEEIASNESIDSYVAAELRERYEGYGIDGDTDYWDAMDNENHYLYGNTFWESDQNDKKLFSFSRKLGRCRTAEEEEEWNIQKKELETKWKQSFEESDEYIKAYKEFIDINSLVHEFSLKHPLDESVMEILERDARDITCNDSVFLKYYSELNRIIRILQRRR